MAQSNPTIFETIAIYLVVVFIVLPAMAYYSAKDYIRLKLDPKRKHMNWLRKLAGIPLK